MLPQMPDWTLLETPGHTPGHVSFWREKDGTLLPGRCILHDEAGEFL